MSAPSVAPPMTGMPGMPDHNDTLLTRELLITLLKDLSVRILGVFPCPIRLVVHGGAAMLLHPGLYAQPGSRRLDTRDVDYIHRAFVEEWRQAGYPDAGERLQYCINATAAYFKLGKDWMNAHADIALPMANDIHGRKYDPIYTASIQPNNVHLHTVFQSPGLTLVSVTPFWAVALKLVRYQKHDPADIKSILRNGTRLNGVQWTTEILEKWLQTECWAMGYGSYPDWLKRDMRGRIRHAVEQLGEAPIERNSSSDHPPPPPQHRLARHKSMTFHPSLSPTRPDHSSEPPIPHSHSIPFSDPQHRQLARRSSMDFLPVIPRDAVNTSQNQHHMPQQSTSYCQTHKSQSSVVPYSMTMPVQQIASNRNEMPVVPISSLHLMSQPQFPPMSQPQGNGPPPIGSGSVMPMPCAHHSHINPAMMPPHHHSNPHIPGWAQFITAQ